MDLQSTNVQNEWISNLQETKTNEYQIYKNQKQMNIESTRV